MQFRKRTNSSRTPAPAAVRPALHGELDLRGLGHVLWQKRIRILGITLIAACAAFLIVNAITPRYVSESRVLLDAHQNVFLRADADKNTVDNITIDPQAVASQIQVVLSRDLARQVIDKEKLVDNPEFDPQAKSASLFHRLLGLISIGGGGGAMTEEQRTLQAYYKRLSVSAINSSRVIAIDFTSAHPALAARIANDIAETYLRMQQLAKQDQTRAAGSWLAGEIDKMRKKVTEAEDKVEQYRAKTNLFAGSNNTSLPSQQLTEMNSQIAVARGKEADLEARARQLRALIRSGKLIDSSDIANSDTMRRLIEQRIALRNQLAEQSTTLLPRHPRIKELKAQVAETDRQIRAEGERLARQLDNDAEVASERLQTLTASLDQIKKMASQTNTQDVELRALEREAKTQRELLESYLVKYREASARDSINAAPPEARIISRAAPALQPAYPKKVATVLIVAFAAFVLSAGFTVTGALLAPPADAGYGYDSAPADFDATPLDAEAAAIESPMPHMPSPPLTPSSPNLAPTPVPMKASSVEQVAGNLRRAGEDGRRVAVIGLARNVGTTYAAITLARLLMKEANVVLVDLALAAPNLSVLSTDPNAPGLAELARGAASFGDIVTRDQFSKLHLVATGNVGDDSALPDSPLLTMAIEALAHGYDHVVIDAGAVDDMAAERIAALAHRAVLVAGDPTGPAARACAEQLSKAGFAEIALLAGGAQAAAA